MRQFLSIPLLCCAALTLAQPPAKPATSNKERFDEHTVHYSVFNSSEVPEEIASAHDIVRAENQVLVNVALVPNGEMSGGQSAQVSGTVTNLMQQQRTLDFQTVAEEEVTYYLAPLRITDEETLHFDLKVQPEAAAEPYVVEFSKQVYVQP